MMSDSIPEYSESKKGVIFVASGEVWVTGQRIILRSDGIGSCVVVAAYDAFRRFGGVAHIMLPGSSAARRSGVNSRYASDAIEELIFKFKRLGCGREGLQSCLIGGGNVLNDKKDTLCGAIVASVTQILQREGMNIVASAVGGTKRRAMFLDIEDGAVYFTEGEGGIQRLYRWEAV